MENIIRLLIIDDDLNDAEMMVSTLKSAGFAVRPERAEDEEELHEKLRSHTPDVIICTLNHPSLTLEKVVEANKSMGRHAPIVAVATSPDVDVVDCMEMGAHDMVQKNRLDHLRYVVTRAAEFQRQWRRLKTYESGLRDTERRCKTLLDSSRDAIAYVHEGMHTYANTSYLELFGYSHLDDIEGIPLMDMVSRENQQALKDFLRAYERNRGQDQDTSDPKPLDLQIRTAGGESLAVQMEFSPATIEGEPCTQILIRNRTSNTRELEKQLNYLAQRDLITGLYNRQYFMERLQDAFSKATQGNGNASLIELRIDRFSSIRDTVGVAGGDLVLGDIGKLLEEVCAEDDIVARFDGEAFAILTRQWESETLERFTHGILETIANHICDVEGRSLTCTASMGVAQIDENAPDMNELLSRAQKACQQAAREGNGHHVVIYRPKEREMTQKQLDETWTARISEAIRDNRLHLLYQPVVSLHGESGERYEVFMRLLDENGEAISPAHFMPSAERTDMAKALDRWVINHAVQRLAAQRKDGHETLFFIKITAGSLHDPGMLPWIMERLKEYRIPAECVVFELKENTVVAYLKQAKEFAKALKSVHCQLALEDFGNGLNPFQVLNHFPADYLKVDASFTRNLHSSEENQKAMRQITDTAHSQNRLILAQQVEDANSLSILWGLGINYIQGNFLQPPSENLEYDFSTMG
ncbi:MULTISPECIES: GGDEF domain-containing response regulator [unclassified Ectothiorhodospira]|uniref:EAL domain-containing response regulator n=1 Tax=unclassified Ectothiorhodospira TaxID=2684909 RepID=UPI001EE91351|nr:MULTISPECIES: GGDEF domain-containing response regulator [unclassified Ectothiorhodospira]MCG5515808.1 EAL domain-containing protein [Ectothiorhodospira sp. 9100]MCG5518894.1 EAL domain-containing protein [Ectothiorhodospira sp. 9905]